MAGSPEGIGRGIPEKVREAMTRFSVDEKQARLLLGCSSMIASETVAKWKSNMRRIQVRKAAELLELIRRAKNGDPAALDEVEAKLVAICASASWER
jgi:hypothetical protein